jgi:hypothetical protein
MAIGGVVINFAAKTADAVRDIGKLDRSLDDVGGTAKKTSGKGGIGGLISSMGAAIPIAGALAVGAVGVAGALIDMSKAALEDSQQAKNLAKTLGNIPGITQAMIDKNAAWIDSTEIATLVSDTDLRAAISKLTLATGDLNKAQDLATLATDVAAGSGKSYSTVVDAMAKAAAGKTTQLQRMYPWLDKNKDGVLTLTEAEKGLGEAFKGSAAEAAKNDPWKRINVIWGQISEGLGGALLPLIEQFGDWFADPKNRDSVQKFINKVADLAEKFGEDAVDGIKDFINWLKSPEGKKAMSDFQDTIEGISKVMGFLATDISNVVERIKLLIQWFNNAQDAWNKIPSWLKGPLGGGHGASPAGMTATTTAATTTATTAAPPPPAVIVTEEQVYRAVQRLLMRGDARNGRLVVVG